MIVVDTNVLLALLGISESTPYARRAFKRDRAWAMPRLWRYEFANALTTLVRGRSMAQADAESIWREAFARFSPNEREVDTLHALRLASKFGITGYDAHFVALADELGVPLVTNDRRSLASKCPASLVVRLSSFAAE